MPTPHELLTRLDAIGASLSAADHSLALIGLGSVGLEMDRLDAYSDLDFFAIVEPGHARQFIDKLDWLERVHPVAYAFKNTDVGYKLLYADGIFCEMAVFDLDELAGIPFSPGRVVWKRAEVDDAIATPRKSLPSGGAQSQEHLLGEALTNLYVGWPASVGAKSSPRPASFNNTRWIGCWIWSPPRVRPNLAARTPSPRSGGWRCGIRSWPSICPILCRAMNVARRRPW